MTGNLIIKQNINAAVKINNPVSVKLVLAGLSMCMLLSSLGTSIANVALPTLAEVFNASFQEAQWVVLAYLLSITTLIVTVGKLGDIFGRRRLLLTGIFLFVLSSAIGGFATNLGFLIAARALQGLGAAAMMTLSIAFIGETVPKDQTGSSMGLMGTMSAVGTALGPSLGGMLIGWLGWQAIFLVNVPLGILTFLLAYYYLPTDSLEKKNKKIRVDKVGTILLVLTLAAYSLALTIGRGSFGLVNAALLLTASIGFSFFIFAQIKSLTPLINLSLFREQRFSVGFALSSLVAMVLMTTLVVGPFYLSISLGLKTTLVGLIMSIGPLVVVLTGIPIGRLVDKFGEKRLTIFGLVSILSGSLLLSLIPASFGLIGYVIPIIVITVGYAIFQTANNTSVMKDVQSDQRGVISGLLNLSRNLGLITGTTLMGAVFALATGTNELNKAQPETVAQGLQITFAFAAILIFSAIFMVVKMEGKRKIGNFEETHLEVLSKAQKSI